ncbi:MAG TPA: cupin domain-containing protein [Vicinamibacterales bacterium]|nr:cupin domain-containing protein [Vicinamibacterales bacterium]
MRTTRKRIPVLIGAMTLALCVSLSLAQAPSADGQRAAGAGGPERGRGRGAAQTFILQQAPADKAVPIPLETLKQYYADMDARKLETLRMLEGGRFNVNIRRITNAESALVHPVTADVWVVTEGAGTLTVNGKLEGGKIVGGESRPLKAGDVVFVPAGVPHGVSGVNGSITWLNIRFDTNYEPAKP